MTERTELHCHSCQKYVQFDFETETNGQLIIICPNCGHEHYRIINDGVVSDERWGSANRAFGTKAIYSNAITCSNTSTFNSYKSAYGNSFPTKNTNVSSTGNSIKSFIHDSWLNTTSWS